MTIVENRTLDEIKQKLKIGKKETPKDIKEKQMKWRLEEMREQIINEYNSVFDFSINEHKNNLSYTKKNLNPELIYNFLLYIHLNYLDAR